VNKKQVYQEKLQAQLDEFNAQIELLKAKAEKAGFSTKLNYLETVEALKLKRYLATNKLQELRDSSDDAWEDMKEGIENAWQDFSSAIQSAISRFK
jgi:hypothetical protein